MLFLQVNELKCGITDIEYIVAGYQDADYVDKNHYKNYQVYIPDRANYAFVAVTLISGHTELYVSTNSSILPTQRKHDFSSLTWPGNYVLARSGFDSKWTTGIWNIAVFGNWPSEYFISVQTTAGKCSRSHYR